MISTTERDPTVTNIVDGDTLDLRIDLGFHTDLHGRYVTHLFYSAVSLSQHSPCTQRFGNLVSNFPGRCAGATTLHSLRVAP